VARKIDRIAALDPTRPLIIVGFAVSKFATTPAVIS
jgi:hypothetical protein